MKSKGSILGWPIEYNIGAARAAGVPKPEAPSTCLGIEIQEFGLEGCRCEALEDKSVGIVHESMG